MLSVAYLALTLALLYAVRGSKPHLIGAVGLLMWMALEKVIYQYGVVESSGTTSITAIYLVYMVVAAWYLRELFIWGLAALGVVAIAWSGVGVSDAYLFKSVKNGIYLTGLLATWMNYLLLSLDVSLLLERFRSWFSKLKG